MFQASLSYFKRILIQLQEQLHQALLYPSFGAQRISKFLKFILQKNGQ